MTNLLIPTSPDFAFGMGGPVYPSATAAQSAGAALTYARRQSLVQALGLTTCDPDIDGASPDQRATITAQQAADIGVLIDEVKADKGRLLKCFGVDRIEDLPQACFRPALNMLQSKRGQS